MKASIFVSGFLEREKYGRKQGTLLTSGISLLLLILSAPFVPWLSVINPSALAAELGLADGAAASIRGGYSVFTILDFVRVSKMGILGLYAMLLLILTAGVALLHIVTVARCAFKRYGRKGLYSLYTTSQSAMLLNFIAAAAAIVYAFFANNRLGSTGFATTPAPVFALILSAAGYAAVKLMEGKERALRREHGFIEEVKRNWILFLFLVPCAVYFIINNYLPMAGIYFAFTQFNFRDGLFASPFVGFKNFEFLMLADLWRLTRNTVLYNIAFIGAGNVLQIFFAILISRAVNKYFKKISQTLIFMPYFVSFVILQVIVYNVLEYNVGLVNSLLVSMGGNRVDFYNTPAYWPFFIVIFYIWKNLGYGMIIYLATIMSINDEYYDAANVDGANVYQQIRFITLPHLKPTFIILLLYALGSIMHGQFELFYQIIGNNGLLFNISDIFDTYVYRITVTQPLSMGLGAAAGLFQSVFGFLIIMITNYFIKRKNEEYALF